MRRDRDLIDYLTMLAAFAALVISIVMPVVEHLIRAKEESPRVAISGWQSRVLNPTENADVLNALFDASTVWRAMGGGGDITNTLRQHFIKVCQYRLFKLKIQNLHNVPASLSEISVDRLLSGSTNTNVVIRTGQLFAVTKADGSWDTSPIINLGPYETKLVPVVVAFIGFDGHAPSPLPGLPHSEIHIKSLCFRVRDNLGRETVSEVIPVREDLITD